MDEQIPATDYAEYYPDCKLQVLAIPTLINLNSISDLDEIKGKVLQRLKDLEHAPSVQIENSDTGMSDELSSHRSQLDDEDD